MFGAALIAVFEGNADASGRLDNLVLESCVTEAVAKGVNGSAGVEAVGPSRVIC